MNLSIADLFQSNPLRVKKELRFFHVRFIMDSMQNVLMSSNESIGFGFYKIYDKIFYIKFYNLFSYLFFNN